MNNGVYLIGSLRNPAIPELGVSLRNLGYDVFDDWFGAGHEADDEWQRYEQVRGRHYGEALQGHAAEHIFHFDKKHLDRCDTGILALPAGKSGHLELGYMIGQGKRSFIMFNEVPERWDLMYKFATHVCFSQEELIENIGPYYKMGTGGSLDSKYEIQGESNIIREKGY